MARFRAWARGGTRGERGRARGRGRFEPEDAGAEDRDGVDDERSASEDAYNGGAIEAPAALQEEGIAPGEPDLRDLVMEVRTNGSRRK